MGEYVHKESYEVKTEREWRLHYKNTSLPRVWTQVTLDSLKLEPVLEYPKPTPGPYQVVRRNGVKKDRNGNWIPAWSVEDMFQTKYDDDGLILPKETQEQRYQEQLDAKTAEANRAIRDRLLEETDKFALSDRVLDDKMKAYRQALRDITTHANWPNLQEGDWPVKD